MASIVSIRVVFSLTSIGPAYWSQRRAFAALEFHHQRAEDATLVATVEARKEPEHLYSYKLSSKRDAGLVPSIFPQLPNAGTCRETTAFHLMTKTCHLVTTTRTASKSRDAIVVSCSLTGHSAGYCAETASMNFTVNAFW